MKNYTKYQRGYFLPPDKCNDWVNKDHIDQLPIFCSVDLRDGNQALITPMTLDEKVRFFNLLIKIGFKEIEVGFPAASETEYNFVRKLIEENLIPDDVTIQVLTQARKHIIKKTVDSIKGAKNVIIHFYNSTSFVQRQQVFKKSKEEVKEIAIEGAKYLLEYTKGLEGNIRFEYSPESFTGTEVDYAIEVCNSVLDILKPSKNNKVIINLPVTVEMSLPHVYASQIEYAYKNLKYIDDVIISTHPHNDRGTGVACAELSLLAGASRVEGTLFGNGERTGNLDIVTLALNLYTHGIDPKLDFSDLPSIIKIYEEVTKMTVHERHPYSGSLVFAAFSGSHQDAIAKGMNYYKDNNSKIWNVPYLPIDPSDLNRDYDSDVIRINSQSGKGGVSYVLSHYYNLEIPNELKEEIGYLIKNVSDNNNKELLPNEIYDIFIQEYVNLKKPLNFTDYTCEKDRSKDMFKAHLFFENDGNNQNIIAYGNGRLDSVANAIKKAVDKNFNIFTYKEFALEQGSTSQAIAYVCIKLDDNTLKWGAGIDNDIITASIKALFSALNRAL